MRYSLDRTVVINNVREGTNWVIPLFIVFLLLKVFNVVTWSWWIITAPLWAPFALFFGVIAIGLALIGIFALIVGLSVLALIVLERIFK